MHAAWDVADEHLANFFGLNESKYEWAVREYYYQKRVEQEEANLAMEKEVCSVSRSQNKPCCNQH